MVKHYKILFLIILIGIITSCKSVWLYRGIAKKEQVATIIIYNDDRYSFTGLYIEACNLSNVNIIKSAILIRACPI